MSLQRFRQMKSRVISPKIGGLPSVQSSAGEASLRMNMGRNRNRYHRNTGSASSTSRSLRRAVF